MKLNPVPKTVAEAGLRALKTICLSSPDQPLSDLQSQFLQGVQKHILETSFDLNSLSFITPEELASLVPQQEFRERIIRACIVASCVDGQVDEREVSQIETFAKALHINMDPVRTAWKLARKKTILARIDIVRKSLPGFKIKQTIQNEGLLATVKQFFPLAGLELPEVTAKYKNLLTYPDGTLGKAYTNYIQENHFSFPGEKGSGPEIIVLHDCLHILGDYGTSPSEEIEVASFQAGCHSNDPIFGLLFGLAQYHLNMQVAPVAPSQSMQAQPEKMIAAFARGCQVNKDMWSEFNPWENFHKNLLSLREELNITSK